MLRNRCSPPPPSHFCKFAITDQISWLVYGTRHGFRIQMRNAALPLCHKFSGRQSAGHQIHQWCVSRLRGAGWNTHRVLMSDEDAASTFAQRRLKTSSSLQRVARAAAAPRSVHPPEPAPLLTPYPLPVLRKNKPPRYKHWVRSKSDHYANYLNTLSVYCVISVRSFVLKIITKPLALSFSKQEPALP